MRVYPLTEISTDNLPQRFSTGFNGFDKTLGGGLLEGATILLAGLPGAGKSTLLIQAAYRLAKSEGKKVLYIAGEENKEQIKLRAQRLGLNSDHILLFEETDVEEIVKAMEKYQPDVMIVDSIQMLHSSSLKTATGSPTQIRNGLYTLSELAKKTKTATFFVGHSTKGGYIAGMQSFQHTVDVTLYLGISEEEPSIRFLRANKNRFGDISFVWELYMTKAGMTNNPFEDNAINTFTMTSAEFRSAMEDLPRWEKALKPFKWMFAGTKFKVINE